MKQQRSLKEYSKNADTNVFTADTQSTEADVPSAEVNIALQEAIEERSANLIDERCLVYLD